MAEAAIAAGQKLAQALTPGNHDLPPPASRTELKLVKSVNPVDWLKVGRSQIWRGELDEPL